MDTLKPVHLQNLVNYMQSNKDNGKENEDMKRWELSARHIMKEFRFSENKIDSVIEYTKEYSPNSSSDIMFNRACRKAREVL